MKRLILIFIIIAVGVTARHYLLRYNIHTVVPGKVYRSAQLQPEVLKQFIQRHGVRTVINLRGANPSESWYQEELATVADLGIDHADVNLESSSLPRIDELRKLLRLLNESRYPMLIHCKSGADRAGLASVIVLIMDGVKDLSSMQNQLSWQYLVDSPDSTGKLFLKAYRKWLDTKGWAHDKEIFLKWVRDDYEGSGGNLYYHVDQINDQHWERPNGLYEEGHVFNINRAGNKEMNISGWGLDIKRETLLAGLDVYLDQIPLKNVAYGIPRADVVYVFGKAVYTDSGWVARDEMSRFADGCHDLMLRLNRIDGSSWLSPPQARICIQ